MACTRCDGDGYVTSPGGDYAAYILTDIPPDPSEPITWN
jgi:hypothetical protein